MKPFILLLFISNLSGMHVPTPPSVDEVVVVFERHIHHHPRPANRRCPCTKKKAGIITGITTASAGVVAAIVTLIVHFTH